MHSILQIAAQSKIYKKGSILRDAIVAMKSKYLKYGREMPFLYAFAFILYPRCKIEAFANVLNPLSDVTWLDYSNYFAFSITRDLPNVQK